MTSSPTSAASNKSYAEFCRSHSGGGPSPLATPREAHEDPFNLVGFFPSRPTESEKAWEWIYGHEGAAEEEEHGEGGAHGEFLVLGNDEIAGKVIEGEDKYGMLRISSAKFTSLIQWKMHEEKLSWVKTIVLELLKFVE